MQHTKLLAGKVNKSSRSNKDYVIQRIKNNSLKKSYQWKEHVNDFCCVDDIYF